MWTQFIGSRFDITMTVKRCYAEYPAGTMALCWWSLAASYCRCLETGGDNNYKTHFGVSKGAARYGVGDLPVTSSLAAAARASGCPARPRPCPRCRWVNYIKNPLPFISLLVKETRGEKTGDSEILTFEPAPEA